MSSITIDGLTEEDFRQQIESDLRHGREAAAIARLRGLLEPYCGDGAILPERLLTVTAEDLTLKGWEYLGDCIARHDRPGRPVTAISIAFGWAGEDLPQVDEQGCLHPLIETGYFNDSAYPFSQSGRDDLLDGYSLHGCTWAADCEATDNALSLDGVDDLYGALAMLEALLLASDEPDPDEICAGSLGACLLSALLFQAVGQRIAKDGLPRPLCVTAGSNGVYPYFDAPVVGMPEHVRKAAADAEEDEAELDSGVPGPRYSSLLMTGIPRAQKRAVLVLAETESEMAVRIARLRGHGDDDMPPEPLQAEPSPAPLPEPEPMHEAAIAAEAAANILLAKKPTAPGWDFRELLSPLPVRSAPAAPEPAAPEPAVPEPAVPEPELSAPPLPSFETEAAPEFSAEARFDAPFELEAEVEAEAEPEASPEVVVEAPATAAPAVDTEPGFPLLADSLQDRLESLLSPLVPINAPVPQPVDEPVTPQPWAPEQAGPVWPFGIEWLEEDAPAAPAASQLAPQPTAAPNSLWTRLRSWIKPRRQN